MNSAAATTAIANGHSSLVNNLSAPVQQHSRSRSPTPQRRPQQNNTNTDDKPNNQLLSSPNLARRSASPGLRRVNEFKKKQLSAESNSSETSGTTTSSTIPASKLSPLSADTQQSSPDNVNNGEIVAKVETSSKDSSTELGNGKADNISDNGSEISDEGYRSLGIIQNNKRASLHSNASNDDAEIAGQADAELPSSTDSPASESSLKITEMTSSPDLVDNKIVDQVTTTDKLDFESAGIRMTDDEITFDIASTTGLRKTGFSDNLYDNDGLPKKGASRIPRSPLPARRKSIDNSNVSTEKVSALPINRKMPIYRSGRKLPVAEGISVTPSQTTTTSNKKDGISTWNGRATNKSRPSISSTTYQSPTASSTLASSGFNRNTATRGSTNNLYDKNGRKIKSASVTTSPVKKAGGEKATSPLAKEILQVAGNYKNDTQIFEKMKELLSKYAKSKNNLDGTVTSETTKTSKMTKTPDYEDFTTAWVNSSGSLELATATVSKKSYSKRSSIVSSTDSSANSKDIGSVAGPPRKDRGCSRIPAPVRASKEIY